MVFHDTLAQGTTFVWSNEDAVDGKSERLSFFALHLGVIARANVLAALPMNCGGVVATNRHATP